MLLPYTDAMLSPVIFEVAAFLLGLLFGSFLNVCISRLPEHRSISKPRSHCPNCKATIRWYDNIPIVSWVLLRARCRNCKAKISWRYPAVELIYAIWLLMAFRLLAGGYVAHEQFGQPIESWLWPSLAWIILGFLLIGLMVIDWQTHTLPDAFTLTGSVIGFLLVCVQAIFLGPNEDAVKLSPRHDPRLSSPGSFAAKGNVFLTGPEHLVFGRLAAIAGAALFLLAIRWLYFHLRGKHRQPAPSPGQADARYGLGLGDVKLLAMIAAFLGFWPAILALLLGCVLTSVYAVILLARRRAEAATQLPFGSFLSLGGLIAAIFGTPLVAWYASLF